MTRGRGRNAYASSYTSSYTPRNYSSPAARTARAPSDPPGALHKIEYAKAGTGKCHGAPPCKGSPIAQGTLRYGSKIYTEQYGDGWLWRRSSISSFTAFFEILTCSSVRFTDVSVQRYVQDTAAYH